MNRITKILVVVFSLSLGNSFIFAEGVPTKPFEVDEHTLFLCHFDKEDFTADYAKGEKEPLKVENVYLDEGKFGNCLCIEKGKEDKDKAMRITYSLKDNINLKQGTIEFWIAPHTDLNILPLPTYFQVYNIGMYNPETRSYGFGYCRFNQWGSLQVVLSDTMLGGKGTASRGRRVDFNLPVKKWRAYEWHYIKITWGEKGCAMYVDGELAKGEWSYRGKENAKGSGEFFLPYPLGIDNSKVKLHSFIIGPDKNQYGFGYSIDELRISDIIRE